MNALKDKILNVYGHGCVVTRTTTLHVIPTATDWTTASPWSLSEKSESPANKLLALSDTGR